MVRAKVEGKLNVEDAGGVFVLASRTRCETTPSVDMSYYRVRVREKTWADRERTFFYYCLMANLHFLEKRKRKKKRLLVDASLPALPLCSCRGRTRKIMIALAS